MFVRLRRSCSAAAARRRFVLGVTLNDIPTVFSASICRCIALRNTLYTSDTRRSARRRGGLRIARGRRKEHIRSNITLPGRAPFSACIFRCCQLHDNVW